MRVFTSQLLSRFHVKRFRVLTTLLALNRSDLEHVFLPIVLVSFCLIFDVFDHIFLLDQRAFSLERVFSLSLVYLVH